MELGKLPEPFLYHTSVALVGGAFEYIHYIISVREISVTVLMQIFYDDFGIAIGSR